MSLGTVCIFGGDFFTFFAQSIQTEDVASFLETFVAEQVNTCRAKLTLALVCLSIALYLEKLVREKKANLNQSGSNESIRNKVLKQLAKLVIRSGLHYHVRERPWVLDRES